MNLNIEQIREYTLSLLGVTEDQPFGDDILTFRLEALIIGLLIPLLGTMLGSAFVGIKGSQ
jgi:hypothetical protein